MAPVSESWNLDRLVGRLNYIVQPAAFLRREAYEAVGGVDRELHNCMDYDLWIKIGRRYPVMYVPEIWAQMRMYPQTKTMSGGLPRMREIERIARRYGRKRLPAWYQPDFVWESFRAGARAGRDGRWREAAADWLAAGLYLMSPYVAISTVRALERSGRNLRKPTTQGRQ